CQDRCEAGSHGTAPFRSCAEPGRRARARPGSQPSSVRLRRRRAAVAPPLGRGRVPPLRFPPPGRPPPPPSDPPLRNGQTRPPKEERQTQIREGAGLEESKLNVEFIDWLQKWSTPILLLIALTALGILGYKKWEKAKLDEVDRGFGELTAAADIPAPNPESL